MVRGMSFQREQAIDIKKLRDLMIMGYRFLAVKLDGELGFCRGYSIEDLADKADFLEVSFLLVFGEYQLQFS
jgi:citrate synthase